MSAARDDGSSGNSDEVREPNRYVPLKTKKPICASSNVEDRSNVKMITNAKSMKPMVRIAVSMIILTILTISVSVSLERYQ